MANKTAILQVADTGPLESLVMMLWSVGYDCLLPSKSLCRKLRDIGCDTVLEVDDLVHGMGYERPIPLGIADEYDMKRADIYVDVKAHRNGPLVWGRWPGLFKKTFWYRINGGKPEHVVNAHGDMGDEVNPPCPVITPNQWYKEPEFSSERTFAFWPPFMRKEDYFPKHGRGPTDKPVCLIHNLEGWGYGKVIPRLKNLVGMYGRGSPDGLLQHGTVPRLLSSAQAMVHLKSNDAPGYALYEAVYARCPVILPRRLVWRCKMQELWKEDHTCLMFDRETHDSLTDETADRCAEEIAEHLWSLGTDPSLSERLSKNAFDVLESLSFSAYNPQHVQALSTFLDRNIG